MLKRIILFIPITLAASLLFGACGNSAQKNAAESDNDNHVGNQDSQNNASAQRKHSPPLSERQAGLVLRSLKALDQMSTLAKSGSSMDEYYHFVTGDEQMRLAKEILTDLPSEGDKKSELQGALNNAFNAHTEAAFAWFVINRKLHEQAAEMDGELPRMFKPFQGRSDWVESAIREVETKGTYRQKQELLEKLWGIADLSTAAAKVMVREDIGQ